MPKMQSKPVSLLVAMFVKKIGFLNIIKIDLEFLALFLYRYTTQLVLLIAITIASHLVIGKFITLGLPAAVN